MTKFRYIAFVFFIFLSNFFPAFANEQEIIKILKEGGKIILIRHSEAPGTGDPTNFDLNDCKTQRNLSKEGIEQAKRLGEFFGKNNIPFEKVYSSEYCRCKDTARYAFKDFQTFSGLNSTFADPSKTPAYMKKTKEFIGKLDKNKNYIFVAHHTTLEGLTNQFANSGEMIITNHAFKVIGNFKVN
jgi:phosphohistidine phosphatase SixA